MNWSIRRPNVNLRVTKFTPDTTVAIPSAEIKEAIAEHKQRRAKEQKKVRLYNVRRAFNQFMYGSRIPLEAIGPVDVGPLEPEQHSCNNVDCVECHNRGLRYGDWQKARSLDGL